MLQEMGVTVWAPAELAEPHAVPVAAPIAPTADARLAPVAPTPSPVPAHGPVAASAPPSAAAVPPPSTARAAMAPATATPPTAAAAGPVTPALKLHAPQVLYPTADPAKTPAELGGGWLIVTESVNASAPLQGDAGRLLDNMLRAMRLHEHPRVFVAALGRALPGAQADEGIAATLADAVQSLQPSMVLVLGHIAARVALGRTEPLGRLRAGPHELAGCPAVVTYDPAFLLRSQDAKAAAWADLCHALALVRATNPGA